MIVNTDLRFFPYTYVWFPLTRITAGYEMPINRFNVLSEVSFPRILRSGYYSRQLFAPIRPLSVTELGNRHVYVVDVPLPWRNTWRRSPDAISKRYIFPWSLPQHASLAFSAITPPLIYFLSDLTRSVFSGDVRPIVYTSKPVAILSMRRSFLLWLTLAPPL